MEPDLIEPSWQQINIAFPTWADAERAAVAHVAPLLITAESRGLITSWFFTRKAPCWRVRYLPEGEPARAVTFIDRGLEELKVRGSLTEVVTGVIYEPETHAFGGAEAMACAHRLFHQDSSHTLAYLAAGGQNLGWRRELSVILCAVMLRAARLDWYEKGDVWAQVARHRQCAHPIGKGTLDTLCACQRRLMTVDTTDLMRGAPSLAFATDWATAFAAAGRELADLAATGQLHRGLRAVLAHHIIFAWNRHGLPYATQAALASAVQLAVFGPDPAAERAREEADQ